jgi:hypothetical protein
VLAPLNERAQESSAPAGRFKKAAWRRRVECEWARDAFVATGGQVQVHSTYCAGSSGPRRLFIVISLQMRASAPVGWPAGNCKFYQLFCSVVTQKFFAPHFSSSHSKLAARPLDHQAPFDTHKHTRSLSMRASTNDPSWRNVNAGKLVHGQFHLRSAPQPLGPLDSRPGRRRLSRASPSGARQPADCSAR